MHSLAVRPFSGILVGGDVLLPGYLFITIQSAPADWSFVGAEKEATETPTHLFSLFDRGLLAISCEPRFSLRRRIDLARGSSLSN